MQDNYLGHEGKTHFDFDTRKSFGKGRSKYNWALWTNGETHAITRGADFTTTMGSMRAQLHSHAKVHGLICKTTTRADTIIFTFDKEENT